MNYRGNIPLGVGMRFKKGEKEGKNCVEQESEFGGGGLRCSQILWGIPWKLRAQQGLNMGGT